MGALYSERCYESQTAALDAYYGSVPPTYSAGSTVYYTVMVKKPQGWAADTYRVWSSGTSTLQTSSLVPVIDFPACDATESFFDGMTIGWGVVLAMAIAWGFRMMGDQAK